MIAFGVLDDAALWLLRDVTAYTYWQQWLLAEDAAPASIA